MKRFLLSSISLPGSSKNASFISFPIPITKKKKRTCEAQALIIVSAALQRRCNEWTRGSNIVLRAVPCQRQCNIDRRIEHRQEKAAHTRKLLAVAKLSTPYSCHAHTTTSKFPAKWMAFPHSSGQPTRLWHEHKCWVTMARRFPMQWRCANGFTMKCGCLSPVPKASNQIQTRTTFLAHSSGNCQNVCLTVKWQLGVFIFPLSSVQKRSKRQNNRHYMLH